MITEMNVFYKLLFLNSPAKLYGGSLYNIFRTNQTVLNKIYSVFGNINDRAHRNAVYYITFNPITLKYEIVGETDNSVDVVPIENLSDKELYFIVSSKIDN